MVNGFSGLYEPALGSNNYDDEVGLGSGCVAVAVAVDMDIWLYGYVDVRTMSHVLHYCICTFVCFAVAAAAAFAILFYATAGIHTSCFRRRGAQIGLNYYCPGE